jgi:uncharacterized membrane protein
MVAACASTPTESTCPPSDPPTYDNFGRQFMASYCTGCHSRDSTDRHSAPTNQNYDSEADIRLHAADIDLEAAAGPKSTNTSMPDLRGPVHAAPSDAERTKLGQLLACMKQ